MGIVGIGVDVCEIARFQAMVDRRPGVIERLFTTTERDRSTESLAARFAAKEALAKALRTEGGLAWHDAEVRCSSNGAPEFALSGTVAERASVLGVTTTHLSMSHDGGVAIAMVVCER